MFYELVVESNMERMGIRMMKKGFVVSCMMGLLFLSCINSVKKESVLADKAFSIQRISEMTLKLENTENSEKKTVLAGWVLDASSGEGLPGVDVLLLDNGSGAVKVKKATSIEGYFRIVSDKIKMNDTLYFEYPGYKKLSIKISGLVSYKN